MFNILLSISIKKIAWFVIHNWVIFAVCAFVICAAMIVWLIREVIKSGEEDEDDDSDKNSVTARTDMPLPVVDSDHMFHGAVDRTAIMLALDDSRSS